jgi:hypothetical protein
MNEANNRGDRSNSNRFFLFSSSSLLLLPLSDANQIWLSELQIIGMAKRTHFPFARPRQDSSPHALYRFIQKIETVNRMAVGDASNGHFGGIVWPPSCSSSFFRYFAEQCDRINSRTGASFQATDSAVVLVQIGSTQGKRGTDSESTSRPEVVMLSSVN